MLKIAGHHRSHDYNNIPGCTYCSPEIASVGMTEKAAKDSGIEIKVGKFHSVHQVKQKLQVAAMVL